VGRELEGKNRKGGGMRRDGLTPKRLAAAAAGRGRQHIGCGDSCNVAGISTRHSAVLFSSDQYSL